MRNFLNYFFRTLCFVCMGFCFLSLLVLITSILVKGLPWLSWNFFIQVSSSQFTEAGIFSALIGTFYVVSLAGVFSTILGILTAIYLEEYQHGRWKKWVQIYIHNLAGVPSVVYGLLGLALFVRALAWDSSILSGALVLSFLMLPIVIITTQEALKSVPNNLKMASYGLGAYPMQVLWGQTLPYAFPQILTGITLSLSRIIGETAPLIMVGALSYATFFPRHIMDLFTALPIQIYSWASKPQHEFQGLAAAGIVVLMGILFIMYALTALIRKKFEHK